MTGGGTVRQDEVLHAAAVGEESEKGSENEYRDYERHPVPGEALSAVTPAHRLGPIAAAVHSWEIRWFLSRTCKSTKIAVSVLPDIIDWLDLVQKFDLYIRIRLINKISPLLTFYEDDSWDLL